MRLFNVLNAHGLFPLHDNVSYHGVEKVHAGALFISC